MSTQRGNATRTRPQKHRNATAFKNTMHDTSHKTKAMNALQVNEVCARCKEIIEWKIKYKKYKPLTQPRKCVKCDQRTVKKAYHIMCEPCGVTLGVCTKCGQSEEKAPIPSRARAPDEAQNTETSSGEHLNLDENDSNSDLSS